MQKAREQNLVYCLQQKVTAAVIMMEHITGISLQWIIHEHLTDVCKVNTEQKQNAIPCRMLLGFRTVTYAADCNSKLSHITA
jgi:hypothetical protein